MELDQLFKNDRRYDGARNCLVEYEPNSTCIYNYLFPKKVLGKKRKLIGGKKSTSYVLLDDTIVLRNTVKHSPLFQSDTQSANLTLWNTGSVTLITDMKVAVLQHMAFSKNKVS